MKITLSVMKDKLSPDGTVPVYFFFFADGKKKKLFTGERVTLGKGKKVAGDWDEKTQRVIAANQMHKQVNFRLEQMDMFLHSYYSECQLHNRPFDLEQLKLLFKNKFMGEPLPVGEDRKQRTLEYYIREYVEINQTTRSYNYLRKHTALLMHLGNYSPTITPDKVNEKWFAKFIAFCHKQHLTNNSIKPLVTILKNAMILAQKTGEQVPPDYLNFAIKQHQTERVAHTQDELMMLIGYRQVATGTELNVLNMYLVACFTGLRWSDVTNLKWSNVKENVITWRAIKTKDRKDVLMHAIVKQILDFYKGTFLDQVFPDLSEQDANKKIKKICEKLGMDERVQRVRYVGSKRVEENLFKWQAVTFHTARHTHAVISLELGMDLVTLQDNLGHQDPKTTRIYAKMADKTRHENTKSVWDKLGE